MRAIYGLLLVLCLTAFVGCGGAGDAAKPSTGDDTVAGNNDGDVTPTDPGDGSGSGSSGGSAPTGPQPAGPKPGDIVSASTPDPSASYPAVGQPIVAQPDPTVEPNTDYSAPIIQIVAQPNPYIPNTAGTIQLRAADNEGGIGLKDIECQIDGGAWTSCGESVDLTGLSEGIRTMEARAIDWDGNTSTEVSYSFYVDTTPPVAEIKEAPVAATKDTTANFEFAAIDAGSGVSHYVCKIDYGTLQRCDPQETLSNLEEGQHTISIAAVDAVGNRGTGIRHDWVVDNSGPIINVSQQPTSIVYVDDPDAAVKFNVTDQYSPNGISTTCMLNGVAVSCANVGNITVPADKPETFNLVITATDALGNMATESITWIAVNEAENRTSTITVDDVRPVDILFVVDNSGSMNEERANLAQRIDGMINVIKGLDWQIGVISTDATSTNNISDGRLIEMIGMPGEYILDSTMDPATAQSVFGDTVQNFGGGSGNEEGIYSTKRLIDRFLDGDANSADFFRNGADFNVVVLSDEDEYSNGTNIRITPQGFLDHVAASFGAQKNVVWHSIIYRPGDAGCTTGANQGNTYDALSRLTGYGTLGGAIIGDVCSQDYTSQLADIGQSVKDLQNSIKLKCSPFDANKDGTPEVTISYRKDSSSAYSVYTASRAFQGDRVVFDDLLPPGDYKADYKCKVN